MSQGLTAEALMFEWENPSQYEMLRSDLRDVLAPGRVLEPDPVDRIAELIRRLRRVPVA